MYPIQPLVQPRAALRHDPREADKRRKSHGTEKSLCQREHRPQRELLPRELIGKVALAARARRVQHPALQRHAHIAADEGRRGVPAREGVDQPVLFSVIIVTEGLPDVPDRGLIQCRDLHAVASSRFCRTATAQGMRPSQSV